MNLSTTETHHRSHFVRLSQSEVQAIVVDAIRKEHPELNGLALFVFDWSPDTVDSGLRKVPQITVRITEDLNPPPEATPA